MLYNIKNQNIKESYPLVSLTCNLTEKYYKETGYTDTVIELNTTEDIMSFMACCQASDDSFKGLRFYGNTITIESGEIKDVL